MKEAAQKAETTGKKTADSIAASAEDLAITASVSAALAKDSDLSAIKINVDTKNGAVTLNGPAPTEAAREKATTLAKAVKGVTSVNNKLVVKAG
jgi:osmotically-inducible protein OsmY